jgi:hypothetical protein
VKWEVDKFYAPGGKDWQLMRGGEVVTVEQFAATADGVEMCLSDYLLTLKAWRASWDTATTAQRPATLSRTLTRASLPARSWTPGTLSTGSARTSSWRSAAAHQGPQEGIPPAEERASERASALRQATAACGQR